MTYPDGHGSLFPGEGRQRERVLGTGQQTAKQRDQAADRRDVEADQRDQAADRRDVEADQRDQAADRRDRELLQESATARLHARLETMPVIEQAKGMIMEQSGCTAEEAFDVLRKASQRSNVAVRDLAAQIVTRRRLPELAPRPRRQRPAPSEAAIRDPGRRS